MCYWIRRTFVGKGSLKMIINRNIESDTYCKLMNYVFQKCDSISLTKRKDQYELESKKIIDMIMKTNNYSEDEFLNSYSQKFLEDMVSQFEGDNNIFDKENWKKYVESLGMSEKKIEQLRKSNRKHAIIGSIMQYIYEKFTESWINRNVGSIITITNHYVSELSGKKNLYSNIYYMKLTKEIQEEILKKQSLFDWCFPTSLEDLCIFKDGYCWLYSVAHEEICNIYCKNEEEYNYLKSIGIEFEEDYFIPLSEEEKKNLYYENFNNN